MINIITDAQKRSIPGKTIKICSKYLTLLLCLSIIPNHFAQVIVHNHFFIFLLFFFFFQCKIQGPSPLVVEIAELAGCKQIKIDVLGPIYK